MQMRPKTSPPDKWGKHRFEKFKKSHYLGPDETNKYIVDEDGNLRDQHEVLGMDENGNTIKVTIAPLDAWLAPIKKAPIDSYKYIIERIVKSILKGEADKEIERKITQIFHPQENLFEELKKDEIDSYEIIITIAKLFEEQTRAFAGENLQTVVERIKRSPQVEANIILKNALIYLETPTTESDAPENC